MIRYIGFFCVLGLVLCLLAVSTLYAASCPYCGRAYGAAAPGDYARVSALRAQHEATCSSRPSPGRSGGTWSPPTVRQPSAAELAWQRALAANQTGVNLSKQRRFKEAEAYYRKALEDAPNNPTMKKNLALSLDAQGNDAFREQNYAAAVSFYEAALALLPDDRQIKENLAYARNSLQDQQQRMRKAAETRSQLDDAKNKLAGLLGNLAAPARCSTEERGPWRLNKEDSDSAHRAKERL